MTASGCYDCLLAYNTLVRVGTGIEGYESAVEVSIGERLCDGESKALWTGCIVLDLRRPHPHPHPNIVDSLA